MAISGIGRPVVVDEEGAKTLEKLLKRQQRLIEANRDLLRKKYLSEDKKISSIRSLNQIE